MRLKDALSKLARLDGKTRIRLRSTITGFIDATIGLAVLGVYAASGAVSFSLPIQLFAALVAIESIFLVLIATGASRRCADPSLTNLQILAACGANLVILFSAPHLVPMVLINFFVAVSYGSLLVSPRRFFISVSLYAGVLGLMLWVVQDDIRFQVSTSADLWLLLLVIATGTIRYVRASGLVFDLRTQLKEKNRALEKLASHDSLTNLWNRRTFMEFVEAEKTRCLRRVASRNTTLFAVAIIDIDHFKLVNDTYGHLVGDKVIAEVASVLNREVRSADMVARYGGEEFTVLLVNTLPEHVPLTVERLRRAIERHDWHRVDPRLARVTVSIGAASWSASEDVSLTLSRADEALYVAKGAGRNCVRVYEPEHASDLHADDTDNTRSTGVDEASGLID